MSGEIRGPVRFLFRLPDENIDIRIEGDAEWVGKIREELGLSDAGWLQPLAANTVSLNRSSNAKELDDEVDESEEDLQLDDDTEILPDSEPIDMGPPPDPSRIPVVRRPIGSLDIHAEMAKLGIEIPDKPNAQQLAMDLEGIEEPLPAQGPLVSDPMAEAWLRELMRIVVRKYGLSALALETIEKSSSSLLGDRAGMELDLWLENLFRQGKLVKVHGGDRTGYGPNPKWLDSRM
jgi:hypothetical protein